MRLPRISTLAAFAYPDFRLVWSGLVLTNLGQWMQTFGLGWLVVQLAIADGNPALGPFYLGVVNLARGLPIIVFGLYGGIVADRVNRRHLLVVTNACALVVHLILAAVTITGHVTVLWVIVLGALGSVPQAFDGTARAAMTPRLVPPKDLLSAIGLFNAAWHGSSLLGPLIGGLMIEPFGVGGIFLVKALSHLPAIWAVVAMRDQPMESEPVRQGNLAALRESFAFVTRDAVLLWAIMTTLMIAFAVRPFVWLLPSIAHDVFHVGARELSWLLAASGVGSFAGALLVAPLGAVRRRGLMACLATLVVGGLLVTFAFQRDLVPALVVLALTGAAILVSNGVSLGLVQLRTPDQLRGRVMSIVNLSFGGFGPIGVMTFGTLATLLSMEASMLIGAALISGLALFTLLRTPLARVESIRDVVR